MPKIERKVALPLKVVPKPAAYSWNILEDGVTQGFLENLFACPERAHLKYEEGLGSTRFKGALKFGDIVHNVLDQVYTRFRDTRNPNNSIGIYRRVLGKDEEATRKALISDGTFSAVEQELEELYGLADVLLNAYFKHYEADFNGRRVWEALEETFSVPFEYGVGLFLPVRGKVDARYRARNRRLWIMDTKTKGQISEGSLELRLLFDLQSMLYLWGTWKGTGELPAGMLYNVMRRPQLRKTTKESLAQFLVRVEKDIAKRPDFYFVRFETAFTRKDVEKWAREFEFMVRYAVEWSLGLHRFRVSGACENKYGTCEFLHLCATGQAGTHIRKRAVPYPELVPLKVV